MSKKIVHILGNGDSAQLMPEAWRYEREGKLLICNIPPFEVQKVYACCMVDFKMMRSLHKGEVNLDGFKWVLGNRPKIYMDQKPSLLHSALASYQRVLHDRPEVLRTPT